MIRIGNYSEAYQLWTDSKIPFNVLREQAWGCIQSEDDPEYGTIESITEEEATEVSVSYVANEPYDVMFGGDIYICETPEDLSQITGMDYEFYEEMKRWPSILDMSLDADVCTYVQDQPNYIIFLFCTNNAGGNTFFIPQHLWIKNLTDSILTEGGDAD